MFFQAIDQTVRSLRFASPAKLNLFLEITGRRDDGFHDLDSVMSKFSLYDYLTFTPDQTGQIRLSIDSPFQELRNAVPSDASNLVVRTLHALREFVGTGRPGMSIKLIKNIPVQAGLGGASGNAAAALLAANQLWNLNLPLRKLMTIGGKLGSDVPFFLGSEFCRCTGRGDQLENLSCSRRFNILVAKPKFGLSTRKFILDAKCLRAR